jgi:hypothetical protein
VSCNDIFLESYHSLAVAGIDASNSDGKVPRPSATLAPDKMEESSFMTDLISSKARQRHESGLETTGCRGLVTADKYLLMRMPSQAERCPTQRA